MPRVFQERYYELALRYHADERLVDTARKNEPGREEATEVILNGFEYAIINKLVGIEDIDDVVEILSAAFGLGEVEQEELRRMAHEDNPEWMRRKQVQRLLHQ